jgi:transcription initiation factor TFIIE subunit alpha
MAEKAQDSVNARIVSNRFVQEYLTTNFGEESVRVIKAVNEEMTDDALAEKCKLKVSEIRKILNKLHNLRLAEYTRIKDKDTGWYSYIWKVNLSSIYQILGKSMQTEMDRLTQQFEECTTVFSYYCPKCSKNNIIEFDSATRLAFKCPNCKKNLKATQAENETIAEQLEELKKKYATFKETLGKEGLDLA